MMIRITEFIHGKGTISKVIKHKDTPPHLTPSNLLAFTETRRPLVFWNITNKCNLSCAHCYINAGPSAQKADELSVEEAKALIDDLANMEIPLLMFSGGEPLVREDFWEMASYARFKGLKVALSTNGTLITRSVAKKIKDFGIEYVGVSLDGANEETHDAIRKQPGSFKKSIQALKNCVELDLKCGIRFTVMKQNYHEIPDLINISARLNIPRFCVYWLVPSGRGKSLFVERGIEHKEVMLVLDFLYRRASELDPERMEILTVDAPQDGVYVLNRLKQKNSPEYENALKLMQLMGDACSAGNRIANIDSAGNIYPCQFAQIEELRIGNVRKQGFSEVWNDSSNPILSAFRNKTEKLKGRCGKCTYKELCGGGCRIRAYVQSGDLWAEDPLCFYDSIKYYNMNR